MEQWRLSFYDQVTRNAIQDGIKTIETRALNPEEPERYFGNICVGDKIIFVNKLAENGDSHKEQTVTVTKVYQRKSFEELRNEDKTLIKKIYSNPEKLDKIQNINDFKQGRDFIQGYIEKVEKNGLVGWEFEMLN